MTHDDEPIGRLLTRVVHLLHKQFADELGLSTVSHRMLRIVAAHDGISQSAIEKLIDTDGATVTRTAKALEAEGLVRRVPNPADNRFTDVFLTDPGRDRLASIDPKLDAIHERTYQRVSDRDLAILRRILNQMRDNLEPADAADDRRKRTLAAV